MYKITQVKVPLKLVSLRFCVAPKNVFIFFFFFEKCNEIELQKNKKLVKI